MDLLTEIRRPIEPELKAYRQMFEETLTTNNPLLNIALQHVMKRQGKMMRPILTLLAARMVEKTPSEPQKEGGVGQCTPEDENAVRVSENVLHAAVAMELLHTASLVHDDIVDESDRRRGQKSVNALLSNQAAVLVGDFLLSKALYHSAQTGSQQVVTWVAELGQTLADGELLQLANLDNKEISEQNYFEVITKKTASLFQTCARCGALLSGAEQTNLEMLATYGECVGICFQMRDDIFDYDPTHDVGKPCGNDMKEGKLTLPVIHAVLHGKNEKMFTSALNVRQGDASEEEIAELVQFTIREGGIAYAEACMDEWSGRALRAVQALKKSDSYIAESLQKYVTFVVGRDL